MRGAEREGQNYQVHDALIPSQFFVMFGTVCDQDTISAKLRSAGRPRCPLSSPPALPPPSIKPRYISLSVLVGRRTGPMGHSHCSHTPSVTNFRYCLHSPPLPLSPLPLWLAWARPPKGIITASVNERCGRGNGNGGSTRSWASYVVVLNVW